MKNVLLLTSLFSSQIFAGNLYQPHYIYEGEVKVLEHTVAVEESELKDVLYNEVAHIIDHSCDSQVVEDNQELKTVCFQVKKMPYKTSEQKIALVKTFKNYSCDQNFQRVEAESQISEQEKSLKLNACKNGFVKLPDSFKASRSVASKEEFQFVEVPLEQSFID